MHEPEESDEPTSPAMRRVFDELEAEFEAGLRREADQESIAAARAELGATVLWEQLARRVGSETVVLAGPRAFRGTVVASYPEFLVLRGADGGRAPDPPRYGGLGRPGARATVAPADTRRDHAPLPVRPGPPRARPTSGAHQGATRRRHQLRRHDRSSR